MGDLEKRISHAKSVTQHVEHVQRLPVKDVTPAMCSREVCAGAAVLRGMTKGLSDANLGRQVRQHL